MKSIFTQKNNEQNLGKKNFFHLCVWIFVIGCLFGYIVEVLYSLAWNGFFVNKQGMIYGPFNQVYGLGAVVFSLCLYKFRRANIFVLFVAGALLGGVFEFICSYLQEIIFKSESWHYTTLPCSINGRTNLFHSVCWGILTVLFFKLFFPVMIRVFLKIPKTARAVLTYSALIFMVLDLTLSACAVYRQAERRDGKKASNFFESFLDEHYDDEYLKNVYPNMKFLNE